MAVRGEYRLANRTPTPIDTIHLRIPPEAEIRKAEFSRAGEHRRMRTPTAATTSTRSRSRFSPARTLQLDFRSRATISHGFENHVTNTQVVENGTFVNSCDHAGAWLRPARRAVRGLRPGGSTGSQPKERMPSLDDEAARRNNYISMDADWVDFEATVSTSPDQIALAPGYLQREWTEGGRRYFHYKMDAPILQLLLVPLGALCR